MGAQEAGDAVEGRAAAREYHWARLDYGVEAPTCEVVAAAGTRMGAG